jgi:alpha-mannosidase
MEQSVQAVLEQIRHLLDELRHRLWIDHRPLSVSVYRCAEPIAFADAQRHTYLPVTPPYTWGPAWSTAWFRVQGEVPSAWAGETVAALIDTGSEAAVWQAGMPVQGLDANRDDFMLRGTDAQGTVDLYVEAAGNYHFGLDLPEDHQYGQSGGEPHFIFTRAVLARRDDQVWVLYHDLDVLLNLAEHLAADASQRPELLQALQQALDAYRDGGDDALNVARARLAPVLSRPADDAMVVNALGHSHIDTAWLWPIRETIRKCARTFSTVLTYMAEYPEYHFVQSQPQLYAFVKDRFPELYARIRQAVADGRWEPQGAMWVEPDCNITSGESLVRQFLYGMQFFRDEFGVESTVAWLPDVFGFSAAMPQILRGCGIRYFMTSKLHWNETSTFPYSTFWWEGIDGSRVLAHQLPARTYGGDLLPGELLTGERTFKERGRAQDWLFLYGHSDGGGGPTRTMLERYRRLQNLDGLPRLMQVPSRDWFPAMEARTHALDTWVGELYLETHRGTYTTQGRVKWENRLCEFLLRDAEFLTAVQPEGAYPAEALEQAWKLVLCNQFHDILPGSSIGWVYEDALRDYAVVRELAGGALRQALATFAEGIDTGNLAQPVMVWNTLSFARSGLVELPWDGDDGLVAVSPREKVSRTQVTEVEGERRLLVEVVDVPPMGYTTYDLCDSAEWEDEGLLVTDAATATPDSLENSLVAITLNAYGGITSYYDKVAQREIIAAGAVGNLFQRFDDRPRLYDAWNIDADYEATAEALEGPATITVVESGPLRATVRVERELTPEAHLVQYIRLEANSRRVDFDTIIDWHAAHTLLKVAFPVAVHSPRATYEIQFGHIERPTHRNTPWDAARFEVPAQKWADLSEGDYGVALLNTGKYGYDIHGNVMRLTLLRSPKHPDPEADMGQHRFTYSLLPHRGEVAQSGVPLAGYDLNVPFQAQRLPVRDGVLAQTHSYFRLDHPNLIIEAVKRAEDGDGVIVRLYEAYRRRGCARLVTNGRFSRATRTDLLERDQEELGIHGGAVELPYRPFEIITLRLR